MEGNMKEREVSVFGIAFMLGDNQRINELTSRKFVAEIAALSKAAGLSMEGKPSFEAQQIIAAFTRDKFQPALEQVIADAKASAESDEGLSFEDVTIKYLDTIEAQARQAFDLLTAQAPDFKLAA